MTSAPGTGADTGTGARRPAPAAGFFSAVEPGRRGEILDAALVVFAERGYDAGTLREIAAQVGVTEPALYRHFASKEQLFADFIELAAGRLRSEAFDLLDSVRPDMMRASIAAALEDRRRAMAAYAPVVRTILTAAAHNPVFMIAFRGAIVVPLRDHLTELVPVVDAHFGLRRSPEDVAGRVRALMSLFVGYMITSMVLEDAPDAAIVDAVMRAMGWE
jgi:AcrR family transcriptional regulator